ncbi:MAG: asparaginyl/glutamyl-tRNA amidotransferase subunit C [Candidatus Moranbacteria bacterium RIFOXYA12_FULL_44_15]|nr:MAG: asparaginyl/glutamyl-tRNA amidotransferase subunit C [Candidatus Moranbacteria bacterium RIFOXYA12_FULL_44_15]OGI34672.1 MAG: asparaginyl/glutamyl-tRNA amidotransferase subunit C [Candidatus Moranbacteria bacterium RIFOXYA2_FULL_43_15]
MISKDEVKHIASLARIGLTDKEVDKFSHDLSSILDWIEQLKEVDVENVEAVSHVTGLENITRQDKAADFENTDGIKKLFPEEKDGYDKVKSVL